MVSFRGRVSGHDHLAPKPHRLAPFAAAGPGPTPARVNAAGLVQPGTLARQASEVRDATARLLAMEQDASLASRLTASADAAPTEPLVKRVSRTLAATSAAGRADPTAAAVAAAAHSEHALVAGSAAAPPARLEFPQILELLLASLDGRFDPALHRQKCASPVPLTARGDAYEPLFYVAKDRLHARPDDPTRGIPVRYQGFTKSTVWFSEARPQWGIVARRMQHQARVKQHSTADEASVMASRAALFFHVFEGFSYVLVRRPDALAGAGRSVRKSDLGALVVEDAAKLVQLWPMRGAATSLRAPRPASPLAPADAAHKAAAAPLRAGKRAPPAADPKEGRSRQSKRARARHEAADAWPLAPAALCAGFPGAHDAAVSDDDQDDVLMLPLLPELPELPDLAPLRAPADLLEADLLELSSLFADSSSSGSDGALSDAASDLALDWDAQLPFYT